METDDRSFKKGMTTEKEYEPGIHLWGKPAFRGQLEEEKSLGQFETKSLEKWKETKSRELSTKERE